MKKLFSLFAALLFAGSMMFADDAVAYTLTPASGSNNTYAGNCDITIEGVTWNLTGNSQQIPWRIGGKNLSGENRTLYSKTAIASNISKISVVHGTSSVTVNSWTVEVASDAAFANIISTLTPTFAASTTTDILRPEGADWSNAYYRFTYNVTVTQNNNKYLSFAGATFYTDGEVVRVPDYYLVGTMTDPIWEAKEEYKLVPNTAAAGEYMLNFKLNAGPAEVKVIGVLDEETTWFPDQAGNLTLNDANYYTIYFRPDGQGGEGWHEGVLYAQYHPLINCAAASALAKDEIAYLNPVQVVYVKDGYNYVKDESGAGLLFDYSLSEQLQAGDMVSGFVGQSSPYSGLPELKPWSITGAEMRVEAGEAPAPEELTAVPTEADLNKYVVIKGVSLEGEFTTASATTLTATLGEEEFAVYNKFKIAQTFAEGQLYDLVGAVSINNEVIQVYFISATEHEEVVPTLPVIGLGASFNDWNWPENPFTPIDELEEACAIAVELEAGDYEFKIVKDGTWLSKNGEAGAYYIHRDWPKAPHVDVEGEDAPNFAFNADVAGEYTFIWTYAEDSLYIIYPERPEPIVVEVNYYVVGSMSDWTTDEAFKLVKNEEAEGVEYSIDMALAVDDQFKVVRVAEGEENVWFPEGSGNNYGENGEITVDGDYTIYFRPNYDGGDDWFYNCIYADLHEEPQPEAHYYLMGSMNDWAVAEAYELVKNEEAEGNEYMIDLTLAEGDQLKVGSVYEDNDPVMYPDGDNYVVDAAHAGDVTIYFRPDEDGGDDWFEHVIYVAVKEEPQPQVEQYCEKAAGHLGQADFADPNGRILLTIEKGEGNNIVVKVKNNNEAGNPKTGLNFLRVNADGSLGEVHYGDGTHSEADVEEVSVVVEYAEAPETYYFTNIHWAYSGWEGEWAIDGLEVSADELCAGDEPVEPVEPEVNYYVVGSMTNWEPAEDYKMVKNTEAEGEEYSYELALTTADQFKVVRVAEGEDDVWYPEGMGNNYGENGEITVDGDYTIYFRPNYDGGDDWFYGCLYVTEKPAHISAPTAAPADPEWPIYQVKAVYSAKYEADCNFGEWQSGTQYAQEEFGKKFITNASGYFGLEFAGMNCSSMESLHLDVWIEEDAIIRVVPIHGGTEVGVVVNLEGQKWNGVNIALSEFEGVTNWSNVYQIKIDMVPELTFWLNNVYFYTTVAPSVDLEDGYYLIGRDNGWTVYDIKAEDKFVANAEAGEEVSEYMLATTLADGEHIKVVAVANNEITAYYPDGMDNEYVVDIYHAGETTVYFRPNADGGADWHYGCIFVPENPDANPFTTWFAVGDTWNTETESYLEWDAENHKAIIHINVDKNGQWRAQVKYQGPIAETGKCYRVAMKMKANHDLANVTVKYQDDVEMVNVPDNALQANVEYVFDEVAAGIANGNGIMVLDFGFAKAGDIIELYDVVVEETECPQPEPVRYYLVGTATNWQVVADEAHELILNPENNIEIGEEYMITTTLELNQGIKVVGVQGENQTWYPDGMGNEYVVDAMHAGEDKVVYFRPNADGGEGWHYGVIFVPANEAPEDHYFIKSNWNGEGWAWQEMTWIGGNEWAFEGIFGAAEVLGVNINTVASDEGSQWFDQAHITGELVVGENMRFVYDAEAQTVTASLVTGIEAVVLDAAKAHKMIIDGNIYIIREGRMFNVTGVRVR